MTLDQVKMNNYNLGSAFAGLLSAVMNTRIVVADGKKSKHARRGFNIEGADVSWS